MCGEKKYRLFFKGQNVSEDGSYVPIKTSLALSWKPSPLFEPEPTPDARFVPPIFFFFCGDKSRLEKTPETMPSQPQLSSCYWHEIT